MNNHNSMSKQNKLAAASLLLMATSYVILMVIYGAILVMPADLTDVDKLGWVTENLGMINLTYVIGYVLFSCLLLVVSIQVENIIKVDSPFWAKTTHSFGLIWALLLTATGLIVITSNNLISEAELSSALAYYHTSNLLSDALGGGIEFTGGVWILLIGAFGFYTRTFGLAFSGFSVIKGITGIATLFSTDMVLRIAFGLTGVVWFIWFAVVLLTLNKQHSKLNNANEHA